jgi:hypothetical protein
MGMERWQGKVGRVGVCIVVSLCFGLLYFAFSFTSCLRYINQRPGFFFEVASNNDAKKK